ncbi:MAG: hypothetical protein DRP15_02185 [Candidatus Aenigmatarchaeota archaeon]|nr:MAG: hypothetical protein DRP15_02185 [Candidatus Aenigmarchaeota archaeon]
MGSGSFRFEGWAEYTERGARTGGSGEFYGSTERISDELAYSVPMAARGCADSAGRMLSEKYAIERGLKRNSR